MKGKILVKFNKEILAEKFNEKEYNTCIELLINEMTRILSNNVKKKKTDFKYTNITNLRNISANYLSPKKQAVVFKLHELMTQEEYSEEQMLAELLMLYKKAYR